MALRERGDRTALVTDTERPGQGQWAAWIVLHHGDDVDPEAVRDCVRHRLARFSVPRDVYFVAVLPRNATGKVVRR